MDLSATPQLPDQSADDGTTRESRVAKLLSVEVRSERIEPTRVVLRNISPHGIGARGDLPLLPCERVTVRLPDDREIAGTVRWVRKGSFGLALDERIEIAALRGGGKLNAGLVTRDTEVGFRLMQHSSEITPRTGFQRSRRDEIYNSSGWNRD